MGFDVSGFDKKYDYRVYYRELHVINDINGRDTRVTNSAMGGNVQFFHIETLVEYWSEINLSSLRNK